MGRVERKGLARLLAPLAPTVFFDTHWERRPLHLSRPDTAHFADLLTLADLETLLSSGESSFPRVQLTRAGVPVAPEDYTDAEGRILPLRLVRHHRDGATVIVSQAQRLFSPLGGFCRALRRELGWRCQANAYLSPPGNRGFAPHHDTHDVFVLQLSGRKTFHFYTGGIDLPFCDERFDPAAAPAERALERAIELGPGDTLYIPRGVAHDALAHPDAPSLHVTLGVFPIVVRDVLREIVQLAAERKLDYRRSVRSGVPGEVLDDMSDVSPERLLALLRDSVDAGTVREALSRLRDDAAIDEVPDCDGLLTRSRVDEAHPDSVLAVREDARARAERHGETLKLRLPGEVLEFGEPMASAVERLLVEGGGRVDGLGDALAEERQVALARRLLHHDVVRVTGHRERVDGAGDGC